MKCLHCGSTEISKYGHRDQRQNYICRICQRQFLEYKRRRGYSEDVKQICLRMRQRGMTYREIEEITGVSHSTVVNWVKQAQSSEASESNEPQRSIAP